MRFEVFLTQLPRAAPARIKAAFAEVKKGVSNGVILKTLETHQVPTVPVAWSDDKRDVNEVVDTLQDLGAECRLVDHGNVFLRIGTAVEERFGGRRYHEDEEDEPRHYKLSGDDREGRAAKIARHALTYLLEALAACALFGWTLWLELGLPGLTLQLLPQLMACALGALAAYGVTHCAAALRTGHLEWKQALPVFAMAGALTLVAPFFLGTGSSSSKLPVERIGRPPSLPFSGLLVELQRRKMAEELAGGLHIAGVEAESAQREAAREDALSCVPPTTRAAVVAACVLERSWEDALACLPQTAQASPDLDAQPLLAEMPTPPSLPEEPRALSAPAANTHRALHTRKAGLDVTFALTDVLWLMAISVTLLAGVWWYERKLAGRKDPAAPAPGDSARAEPAPAVDESPSIALEQTHADALRALGERHQTALAELRAELSARLEQAEAERSRLAALVAQRSEEQRRFEQEAAKGASEVARAMARAERAEAEAKQLRALSAARQTPANDAKPDGPTTGVGPMPSRSLSEDSSSYSVSGGQEERVVLPKRRR